MSTNGSEEERKERELIYYQLLIDREQREYAFYAWQAAAGAEDAISKKYERVWRRTQAKRERFERGHALPMPVLYAQTREYWIMLWARCALWFLPRRMA